MQNFESQNKVSRYFCNYFRKLIAKKLMEMLIIVHRPLRSHPAIRHTPTTPTTPAPKAPQRHSPQLPTLLQDTKKVKHGLPSFSWCPSRKRRVGENPILGPPRAEIARKYTPPHRMQPHQPANIPKNIREMSCFATRGLLELD